LQWSIEIAGSGSELKEFMCALVQHFHCPLSSNIISGVLKSFNSEELQREQWAVSSEELQQQWYTKSRVLFVGKVNYNDVSEYSILPFEDAFPRASPMLLWTTLPLPSIYILRSLRSRAFLNEDYMAAPSPSQVSDVPFSRWFDFRSVTYNLALNSAEDYWCPPWSLPIIYVVILIFSRAIPTWLPSFVSSLPLSFMYI
jgi:hypothetical protein